MRPLGCPYSPSPALRCSSFLNVLSCQVSVQGSPKPRAGSALIAQIDRDPCFILKSRFACFFQLFSNLSPESHLLNVLLQPTSIRASIREEYEKEPGAHLMFPGIPGAKGTGPKQHQLTHEESICVLLSKVFKSLLVKLILCNALKDHN